MDVNAQFNLTIIVQVHHSFQNLSESSPAQSRITSKSQELMKNKSLEACLVDVSNVLDNFNILHFIGFKFLSTLTHHFIEPLKKHIPVYYF